MNIFWISFSYKGKNNGVCLVMADDENSALDKADNLGIKPDNDDIMVIALSELGEEDSKLEFNRLYSREEMIEFKYKSVTVIK